MLIIAFCFIFKLPLFSYKKRALETLKNLVIICNGTVYLTVISCIFQPKVDNSVLFYTFTETFWLVLLLGPRDVVKLTFLTFLQMFKMLFASSILISSVNMVGNSSIMLTLTKNVVPGWMTIFKHMKIYQSA